MTMAGKERAQLSIFAVYIVGTKKVILKESQTSACQQWRERRRQGVTNILNPREETLSDLNSAVRKEMEK